LVEASKVQLHFHNGNDFMLIC